MMIREFSVELTETDRKRMADAVSVGRLVPEPKPGRKTFAKRGRMIEDHFPRPAVNERLRIQILHAADAQCRTGRERQTQASSGSLGTGGAATARRVRVEERWL